jgi:hypothetical protein
MYENQRNETSFSNMGQRKGGRFGCNALTACTCSTARDAAEVALHDADHVRALNAGATAVVYNSGQAKQQGRQRAATAQQLQPLLAQVNLVLQ